MGKYAKNIHQFLAISSICGAVDRNIVEILINCKRSVFFY